MKIYKLLVGCCVLGLSVAVAEELEPLPKGVHQLSYTVHASTFNQFAPSSGKPQSWLLHLAEQNNLEGSVAGKLSQTEFEQRISYQYGLNADWLLWAVVPYWQKKRQSSATATHEAAANFVENLRTVSTSGVGDFNLGLVYKFSSAKSYYVQLGGGLELATGKKQVVESKKLSTGNGVDGMHTLIRVHNYSLSSTYHGLFELQNFWYFPTQLQPENGATVAWNVGNKFRFKAQFAWRFADWDLGFGLLSEQQGYSHLAGEKLDDAYRQTQGLIFAQLDLIDDQPAYVLEFSYLHNLQNFNRPMLRQFSLGLNYFF